jgi:hypothetical protein
LISGPGFTIELALIFGRPKRATDWRSVDSTWRESIYFPFVEIRNLLTTGALAATFVTTLTGIFELIFGKEKWKT